jgi:hypothetical protein
VALLEHEDEFKMIDYQWELEVTRALASKKKMQVMVLTYDLLMLLICFILSIN